MPNSTSEDTNPTLFQVNRDGPPREEARDANERSRPAISFFIPGLSLGGAEQVTVNLVNGLANRGYDIQLLLSRFEGKLKPKLSDKVKVIELAPSRTLGLGVAIHLPALIAYLRSKQPVALISQMSHVNIVCLAANRFIDAKTKIIPTEHKAYGASFNSTLKSRAVAHMVPYMYADADRIIAVSEGVADSLVKNANVERDAMSVLHNPVDVRSVRKRARDPVDHEWLNNEELEVILFVGRIERQKDLETWLHAFKRVYDRNSDVRAVIVGQGSHQDDLQELTGRLGIADIVSMPGYVDNPYAYMHNANLFLLSSRYEGLPTVLIEALACECPVVATDCPTGPREILADGCYGNLAPVGDVPRLADAIQEGLNDPIDPGILRERANEFATEAILDDYERFIEDHVI